MGEYYRASFSQREDSLSHHGIKGQKWGVRRFQYENGSYTPEGRERYRAGGSGRSNGSKGSSEKGNPKGPLYTGIGASGGPARGLETFPLKTAAASFVVNTVRYQIRKHNTKKEIERAQINKDRERITKDNIKRLATKYNKKERNKIIQSMKDDPNKSFDAAEKLVKKERDARIRRNTAIFLAANVVLPVALAFTYANRHRISDKLHRADDAIKRNKMYQSFMQSVKNRKVKNSVVLRSDEYEIDRKLNLPSGRG